MKDYATYSDEQLLVLLKESDEQAFDTIYYRYWKRLFTLACNKLKDLQLAEEIIQDTFVRLWDRREALQITGPFASYLSAAIKYKIIDASLKLEKMKARERLYPEIDENFDIADPSSFSYEFKDQLSKILHNLPEKSQLVFELSKQEGYSHKEIADHLNISEKTVEYHLSKTVKLLRTGLGNFFLFLITLL